MRRHYDLTNAWPVYRFRAERRMNGLLIQINNDRQTHRTIIASLKPATSRAMVAVWFFVALVSALARSSGRGEK